MRGLLGWRDLLLIAFIISGWKYRDLFLIAFIITCWVFTSCNLATVVNIMTSK